MFVQKPKRSFGIDRVTAVEVFDLSLVLKAKLNIDPAQLCIFMSDPLVPSDMIVVTTFDHERSRDHEISHLRIVKRLSQIKVGHLPFNGVHETERLVDGCYFVGPAIEIARAD